MAFAKTALKRIAFTPVAAGDFASKYFYATADAVATVETAGYFTGADNAWLKGDVVEVSMVRTGTPVFKTYVVTAVNASNVPTLVLQTTT